jgi:hypothetical protein
VVRITVLLRPFLHISTQKEVTRPIHDAMEYFMKCTDSLVEVRDETYHVPLDCNNTQTTARKFERSNSIDLEPVSDSPSCEVVMFVHFKGRRSEAKSLLTINARRCKLFSGHRICIE